MLLGCPIIRCCSVKGHLRPYDRFGSRLGDNFETAGLIGNLGEDEIFAKKATKSVNGLGTRLEL